MAQPPKTEKELAQQREIGELLSGLAETLQQQNLDNAVRLAQQAARHQGELVDHFAELGDALRALWTNRPCLGSD